MCIIRQVAIKFIIITKRNITHDRKTGIRNWCESHRDWFFKVCKYLSVNQLK